MISHSDVEIYTREKRMSSTKWYWEHLMSMNGRTKLYRNLSPCTKKLQVIQIPQFET